MGISFSAYSGNIHRMMLEDFAETYRQMADEQLEEVIGDLHNLVDDARTALLQEFNSRGRTSQEAFLLAEAGKKRTLPLSLTEGVDRELTARFGTYWDSSKDRYSLSRGIALFGKDNRVYDKMYDYEEFDTEFYPRIKNLLPLPIPMGCFRIRIRTQSGPDGREFAILRKL